MSLHRKWFFYLAGLVTISLTIAGAIMWESGITEGTMWGLSILTPLLYASIVIFSTFAILRLIYVRGFPGQ